MQSEEDLWAEENEKVPMGENASKRLAVVNLDWDQINAKDLMAIFSSLCKDSSSINKVEIYVSEYGKEQMKNDSLYGPQKIWSDNPKTDIIKEEEELAEEASDGNDDPLNTKPLPQVKRKGKKEDFDPIALRKYELQKLKYFFAVIHCDTLQTAQYLYDEYDGYEYENSSIKLDLRFIPDDLKFPNPPKEICDKLDPKYEPKLQISNSALQQSQVKLTWEAPNLKRFEAITKNLSSEKLEEMDLKEYLGSDSEESEEKVDVEKYKKLLSFTQAEDKRKKEKAEDLHISFKSGLEEDIAEDTEKKDKKIKKGKRKGKEKKAENDSKLKDELELLIDKKKDDFKVDTSDNRFDALYKDKRYLIDPSSKDFKKAGKEIRQEQIKKKKIDEE